MNSGDNVSPRLALPLLACLLFISCASRNAQHQAATTSAKPESQQINLGESVNEANSSAAPTAAALPGEVKVFKGTIGDKYRIQMSLRRHDGALSGSYFYENKKGDIALLGTIDAGGNFTLQEFDAGGAQTGVFKGRWKEANAEEVAGLSGKWAKPDGSREVDFSLAAEEINFSGGQRIVSKKIKEENKKRKYSIEVEYPQIEGTADPHIEDFNRAIAALMTKEVNAFRKNTGGDSKEEDLTPDAPGDDLSIGYDVALATDQLASIEFSCETYSHGAAHPSHYFIDFNYDLQSGRPLKLADLFKPDAKYLRTLSAYCIKDLKRQAKGAEGMLDDADWIQRGAAATTDNYGNWSITGKGLVITFGEYQVAPYVAGPQTVTIPYAALKEIVNPDGPLSKLMK